MSRSVVLASLVLYRTDRAMLERCLQSIARQELPADIRIVLGFRDNLQGHDRELLDDVLADLAITDRVAVRLEGDNVGFGAGHNALFAAAQEAGVAFDYDLCVNPDAILHRDAVARLVGFARQHQNEGLFEARQFPREHPKPYDPQTFETPWCSGCVLLVPRAVYERIGGFDPEFFMYCEDVDLSWRA
ncbi:MAG: glycosyltransferase, partial [Cyanobacteria bacterium REEB65]|nr:glycosyltransferase [Cyanobacteria bacterium REEB65]